VADVIIKSERVTLGILAPAIEGVGGDILLAQKMVLRGDDWALMLGEGADFALIFVKVKVSNPGVFCARMENLQIPNVRIYDVPTSELIIRCLFSDHKREDEVMLMAALQR